MTNMMTGAYLPGNSTVMLRDVPIPEPDYGQVLIQTGASTICGSDIRAIFREHLGKGPEGYQDVVCGHEPAGRIVQTGPGMRRFQAGDRVALYHISGCGVCNDCRRGYMISCSSPLRAAYGWQRDGGMAAYILAEEKDCIALPDFLTYEDGACVACGYGTVFEAMLKIGVSGLDRVLVVGLGPVGLAALQLARSLGASRLIGVDVAPYRCDLARRLNLADYVFCGSGDAVLDQIRDVTGGHGCEKAIDCSAHPAGRLLCLQGTRQWGKIAFVGEGGEVAFAPSRDIIHDQKTIYGSWVTSLAHMELLVEKLVEWNIHPHDTITHRFPLERAAEAYALMAAGECGKVAITFEID